MSATPADPSREERLAALHALLGDSLGDSLGNSLGDSLGDSEGAPRGRGAAERGGAGAVATGWPGLDALCTLDGAPGLARGALHEWFGLFAAGAPRDSDGGSEGGPWVPPLTLLAHLAARALGPAARGHVVWVGRAVWPYSAALLGADELREAPPCEAAGAPRGPLAVEVLLDERPCPEPPARRALFARSLLVDPPDAAGRLWAADAALRCASASAVVVDGSGFDMAATRRLALAAGAGGALALVARPPRERHSLSAAVTRWRVARAGASLAPRWRLELLRAKPPQREGRERARPRQGPCNRH